MDVGGAEFQKFADLTMRIANWTIPAGTRVWFPSTLIHHDPMLYERPHEFHPERWLDGAPPKHSLVPFGGGTRRCLGAAFATMEMRVVLREILRRVDLKTVSPAPERSRATNVFVAPVHGTRVIAAAAQ